MHTEGQKSQAVRLSQEEAQGYLEGLHTLANAVDKAMEALVARELPSLQNSVDLQRTTCARLSHIAQRCNSRLAQDGNREADSMAPDLAAQIRAAAETLLVLNRNYSALLKHSGDTLRLFAGLFRGYHGSAQSIAGNQASLHTWSCEL